jgi:hypothetical protein
MKTMTWFAWTLLLVGIALVGFLVGALTGMSSSPVVGTLIPVLFSLVSSASGLIVAKRASTERARAAKRGVAPEEMSPGLIMKLMGAQILAFCLGFLPAVWLGVRAKLHPDSFFGEVTRPAPAYTEVDIADLRLLEALRILDGRLINSGMKFDDRKRMFAELVKAMKRRREVAATRLTLARQITTTWEVESGKLSKAIKTAQDLVTKLEKDSKLTKDEALDLQEKVTAIRNSEMFDLRLRAILREWDALDKSYIPADDVSLNEAEIKAVEAILGLKTKSDDENPVWRPPNVIAEHYRSPLERRNDNELQF